jgi:hypothetical protein
VGINQERIVTQPRRHLSELELNAKKLELKER